jgi:hypothetical protein
MFFDAASLPAMMLGAKTDLSYLLIIPQNSFFGFFRFRVFFLEEALWAKLGSWYS